jgi:hypothetical protein
MATRLPGHLQGPKNLDKTTSFSTPTVGGISLLETGKKKAGADPKAFVVKALSWWLALCGRLRVASVEDMVWAKFPRKCPYCQSRPHLKTCKSMGESPRWDELRGNDGNASRPKNLNEWQTMFREIYPDTIELPAGMVYASLTEELGELAEAVRVFDIVPGLFLDEAPDVFAWIMQLQNAIDRESDSPSSELQTRFCKAFPDLCTYCAAETCQCPAILPSTIGRLGGSIPPTSYKKGDEKIAAFMTADDAAGLFGF